MGLEIDPGVTVIHLQTHAASGQLIQIDITGLQPENCALGGSVDACDILISDKPTTSNEEICIVTENISNDIAQPAWTITTNFKYKIWSAASVSTLTIGILAFLCFFCFCCTRYICCTCIKSQL